MFRIYVQAYNCLCDSKYIATGYSIFSPLINLFTELIFSTCLLVLPSVGKAAIDLFLSLIPFKIFVLFEISFFVERNYTSSIC